MDNQGQSAQNNASGKQVTPVNATENSPATQPATEEQLQEAERKIEIRMSAFERSMVRLTWAAVIISVVTAFIFAGQLYEMISGGTQTDKLINYAQTQAQASSDIAKASGEFTKSAAGVEAQTQIAASAMKDSAESAKSSAEISNKLFEASSRPYIGIEEINLNDNPEARILTYNFRFKNFSTNAPAFNSDINWCMEDGSPVINQSLPARPTTMNPGQGFNFAGQIRNDRYEAVMAGTATLYITLFGEYEGGNKKHYTYCEKQQYGPHSSFFNLGECDLREEQEKAAKNGCLKPKAN